MYKTKRKGVGQLHRMEKEAWKQVTGRRSRNRTGWQVLPPAYWAAGLNHKGCSLSLGL